jgi:hypothetical protein
MKLIIVNRSKTETYTKLREQFADDQDVKVVFEQRHGSRSSGVAERRRLQKSPNGRDFIVIHTADEASNRRRK